MSRGQLLWATYHVRTDQFAVGKRQEKYVAVRCGLISMDVCTQNVLGPAVPVAYPMHAVQEE